MSVAEVRAEIKSWERSFKEENARAPTVEDIRLHPRIAEKYKLYKRLSKPSKINEVAQRNHATSNGATICQTSIIPKSLPVHTPASPNSINPFSPKKSKAKSLNQGGEQDIIPTLLIGTHSQTGRRTRTPSPPVHDTLIQGQDNHPLNTLKKARKRLHGDPVTPTPRKTNKRVRMDQQSRSHRSPSPASDSEESDTANNANLSYVVESPVKPTNDGKSFKHLFEEAQSTTRAGNSTNEGVTRPISSLTRKLERVRSTNTKRTTSADSLNWLNSKRLRDTITAKEAKPGQSSSTVLDEQSVSSSEQSGVGRGSSKPTQMRKRSSSGAGFEDDLGQVEAPSELLPPSPPPGKATLPRATSAAQQRNKRAKTQMQLANDEHFSDTDSNEPIEVIEENPLMRRRRNDGTIAGDGASDVEDMITASPSKRHSAFATSMNAVDIDDMSEDEILEVDLPDDLHRVLSIHGSRGHDLSERELAQAVLQGSTPTTGIRGEVWGIGEIAEGSHNTDGEDDWASEGVPWEVAEL